MTTELLTMRSSTESLREKRLGDGIASEAIQEPARKTLANPSLYQLTLRIGIVSIICSTICFAADTADRLPKWLSDDLKSASIPSEAVAVYVRESANGTEIIRHNSKALFKPASIIKVLTTYSALEVLGEEYQWHTPIYVTGIVIKGQLNGDLIIRGVGDPSLSVEKIHELAGKLIHRGVRTIKGDVIIDKSFYGFNPSVPEQFYRETENPWNLPTQALLVGGKMVTLTVSPDKSSGGTKGRLDPDLPNVRLENVASFMPGPCANPKDALKVDVLGDANAATIRVSGALAEQCGAFIKKISLLSADAFFAGIFRSSFERQGGKVAGQIREGKAASNAKFFTSIDSDSLMEILRTTNKNSNNLMAQQLFLTIGAELTGKPPTFSSSAAALQRWIGERIPETASFVLENGSGLSDNERVTAKGMVALLDHIRTSRYAAQFLDTLPAVGEDGTMKNRLRDDPVAGRSVAKTGTLRDTRAIAGVLFSKNGHTYTFAMIVNDRHAAASRDTIDKLIAWLHGLGDRGR